MWTIVALSLLAISLVGLWMLPVFLRRSAEKWRTFHELSEEFYAKADILIRDDRTPTLVLDTLETLSILHDRPKVTKWLLWALLRGRVRRHAQHPPQEFREFMGEVTGMPENLRKTFAEAIAAAFMANASRAGFIGQLFLNLIFPDPVRNREAATNLAAEMATSCVPQVCHAA